MRTFTHADVAIQITTRRHSPGWTFVVDIRDRAGTLLKTLRSDEVVYLGARLAEQAAADAAREWIDEIWTWRQRLGARPRPPS